jgi:hypothetical protein
MNADGIDGADGADAPVSENLIAWAHFSVAYMMNLPQSAISARIRDEVHRKSQSIGVDARRMNCQKLIQMLQAARSPSFG